MPRIHPSPLPPDPAAVTGSPLPTKATVIVSGSPLPPDPRVAPRTPVSSR
jgi:hypothetical protein